MNLLLFLAGIKVENETISNDVATVFVTFKIPNLGTRIGVFLFNSIHGLININPTLSNTAFLRNIIDTLSKNEIDYITVQGEISLFRDNSNWIILHNWKKKDKIEKALIDAIKLGKEGKVVLAIAELKNILEVDKHLSE